MRGTDWHLATSYSEVGSATEVTFQVLYGKLMPYKTKNCNVRVYSLPIIITPHFSLMNTNLGKSSKFLQLNFHLVLPQL